MMRDPDHLLRPLVRGGWSCRWSPASLLCCDLSPDPLWEDGCRRARDHRRHLRTAPWLSMFMQSDAVLPVGWSDPPLPAPYDVIWSPAAPGPSVSVKYAQASCSTPQSEAAVTAQQAPGHALIGEAKGGIFSGFSRCSKRRGRHHLRHHVESCQQQGEEILQQEAVPEELGALRGQLHEQSPPDTVHSVPLQHRRAGRRGREGRLDPPPEHHRGVGAVRRQRLRGVPLRRQGARGGRAQEPRQHLLHERDPPVPEQHGAVRRVPGAGAVQRCGDEQQQRRQGQAQRGAGAEEGRPAAAGVRGGDGAAVRPGAGSLDLWVHTSAQQRLQGRTGVEVSVSKQWRIRDVSQSGATI